jgi:multicomponent Na+:H+ antiporter subunit B
MLSVVSSLPTFGSSDNPTVNEVVDRYVSKSIEETGTVNSVAGMISAYRGFDTLGEAHVLFVAACSVIVLLRVDPSSRKKSNAQVLDKLGQDMSYEPKNDIILQKSAMILVPLAFIFGLYVILNGTSSPGGGFSGGAIIGAGLILHTVAFGFRRTERFFNDEVYHIVKTTCLTVYAILMAYFIYTGANGLNNHVWLGIPGTILSGGIILPINIAVGFEVACTMYSFYALFRKGGL